ncbi:MAG: SCO family protein [Pseudomonadota bacterium]
MRAIMLPAAIGVVALIGAAAVWLATRPSGVELSPAMLNVQNAEIGGPFELTKHTGERMTSDAIIDGPTLVYFGYTYCPDVCPFDVQVMVDTVDILAEKGIEVTPVFITVDPARDTADELSDYVEAMHPNLVALTGTQEEIAEVAKTYKVYYSQVNVPDSEADYLMQHTAFTYLMTPDHNLAAMFRNQHPADQIASDVERVLNAL